MSAGPALLSGTQTLLWRVQCGAASEEGRQPWREGLARASLGISVILLGTLFHQLIGLLATEFPGDEEARGPGIRCSGLLLLASEGLAFPPAYVSTWLPGRAKGEEEADE